MKFKSFSVIYFVAFVVLLTAYSNKISAMNTFAEKIYDDKVHYRPGDFEVDQNKDGHFFTHPCKPQKPTKQCILLYDKEPQGAVAETGKYETVLKRSNKKDGREWIDDTKIWPYSIHSQLTLNYDGDIYVGSGVLISPHHVITAAHNIYKPEHRKWADSIEIYPGLTGKAAYFGSAKAARVYTFNQWVNNANDHYDCAIIVLDQPVGLYAGWGGLFGCENKTGIPVNNVSITGYPVDKGCTQMWTMMHSIKNIEPETFSYEIDTEGGQSGGGIWTCLKNQPYILGVHTLGDVNINSGVRLSRYKFNEILNWISKTKLLIPIPLVARGHEEIYLKFLGGRLIYRPDKRSDIGEIDLPIEALANPLDGTFDLSRCGDAGKYLSISTGYRKEKKAENANKVEIWFTPRFLIAKELNTTASHFQKIFDKWDDDSPIGVFWTWGGWDELGLCSYLTIQPKEGCYSIGQMYNYRLWCDPPVEGGCCTHFDFIIESSLARNKNSFQSLSFSL